MQLITVAAGGTVRANPKGREIGVGRRIALTSAGREHPMYAGKAPVFDAVTVHLDEIETLAPGTTVLAANAQSAVQAAEIEVDGAVAWAVQYHPEFSLADMAAIVRRYGQRLIGEGFFADEATRDGYVADLALDREPDSNRRRAMASTTVNRRCEPWKSQLITHRCRRREREGGMISQSPCGDGRNRRAGTAIVGALLEAGAICHAPYLHEDEAKRFPQRAQEVSLTAPGKPCR